MRLVVAAASAPDTACIPHSNRQKRWACWGTPRAQECPDRRIDSIDTIDELERLLAAWGRNRKGAPVRWQFTTANARIKLRRLYPII